MKGILHRFIRTRRAAMIAACCVVLTACDSGSSTISPPIDDSAGSNEEIINSQLSFRESGAAVQRFVLNEDTLLRGRFYSEDAPAEGPATIRSLPAQGVLTLQAEGQVFLYTVTDNYFGEDAFSYISFDGQEVNVELTIASVNDAPVLSADIPRVAEQGRSFEVQLNATDVDDTDLRYSANGLPSWLSLNATSGLLVGQPNQTDIGFSGDVTFRVTDPEGLFTEVTGVRFEVIDVNDPPTLNITQLPVELNARESVTAQVFPDDLDGDTVTISVESNDFISSEVNAGSITLTAADVNDVTDVNLVITARDRQGTTSREIVPITLYPLTASGAGRTLLGSKQGRGVHLVALGDGYAEDQQALFREHVDDAIASIRADQGIGSHIGAFNIHMINTVSVNSGADDNEEVDSRDTAFDSAYNCGGVLRLICANTLSMFETALGEYPSVDQIVLLVNDRRYGGSGNSGGSVAITSAYFPEIAVHEMGHSLVDLADEYVDTLIEETSGLLLFQEGRYKNVTALTDPTAVPWAHWIDPSVPLPQSFGEAGVGLFEGGLYRASGIFRPTFNSRMRSFDASFGPVNSEQWILRLYSLTEGIRGFSPNAETIQVNAGETQEFLVSPIFGEDVQLVEWTFNGVPQTVSENEPNRLVLSPPVGTHTVALRVSDISGKIKLPAPHAGIFNWTWQVVVE